MTIKYRTAGDWGPGVGANLAPEDIDENFWELDQRVETLETTPPVPISIDHFLIEGTLLTIILTNGTEHGPFVLPLAQWRWTGPWQPSTQYFVGDIVQNDGNLYFIRVQHISDTTFDPDLFTIDGEVYILIMARMDQPYDIGMFYNDLIESGSGLLMLHVAARAFEIPVNFADSQAFLHVPTTTTPITLPIYKDDGTGAVLVGSLQFEPGAGVSGSGQFGVFVTVDSVNPIEMAPGDRLSIGQPYEDDPTAASLSVTILTTVLGV